MTMMRFLRGLLAAAVVLGALVGCTQSAIDYGAYYGSSPDAIGGTGWAAHGNGINGVPLNESWR